ncbi:hypothetical protein Back11_34310 [Paenibacillus baekrokdamisoli]|uniref:Uncharacterized protein n=1 Tax=Paenibacillus baekrokdamisoli TaxID=1712516 RepID=A0A3G9IUK3_9BACL|nr:S-layer homology domain-containing protein [Paenibacillus baekrokdamisoli]MBB3070974.1 hypothetical protein [Paenibacillus baekrokdamisoli]BBH22086.1 hypothetical protein Back11_34310 [Paenibacillus baekrokdamisoli]
MKRYSGLVVSLVVLGSIMVSIFASSNSSHAEATTKSAGSFFDVKSNFWAKSSIDYAVSKGYLKGVGNGLFKPDAPVTRAELAAVLSRVSINTENQVNGEFPDLAGHWSKDEVNRAAALGFFKPIDFPNGFKPTQKLTRTEMAKWMVHGLAAHDADFGQALKDTADTLVPVAEYYKGGLNKLDYPIVSVALGTGLMTGYPDGTFGTGKTTTRAEVAAILMRYESIQTKAANSYRDLNEMRALATQGTNLEIITPYVIDPVKKFTNILNKKISTRNNIGTLKLKRMVVVDYNKSKQMKGVYAPLFVDKTVTGSDEYFYTFSEVSFTPNVDKLEENTFVNGSSLNIASSMGIRAPEAQRKYGILSIEPEWYPSIFKKGIESTFWVGYWIKRNNDPKSNSIEGDIYTIDGGFTTIISIPRESKKI